MKKTVGGIFVFLFMLSAANLLSQARTNQTPFSMGVVDIEAIVKEMPEALAADRELLDLTERLQGTILTRQSDLETRFQNYQRQKAMMSAAAQQQEEERFTAEMQELRNVQQEAQNEITQARERLLEPIRTKVRTAIETVAKDEGISMVLSKESAFVMYSEPRLDITFRVIDRIKRGN